VLVPVRHQRRHLTGRLTEIVADVRKRFDGVHRHPRHNDSDVAVANTIAAVEQGATHVQGCMNGYGERCGNANLCSVIANLELKLGHTTIGRRSWQSLTPSVARFIAELANLPLRNDQPFVGRSAFAHKGGIHVSAVLKDSATYEHMKPEARRQPPARAGQRSLRPRQHPLQAQAARPGRPLDDAARRELLDRIKQMEYEGYELEAAEGTFELLVREALHPGPAVLRGGQPIEVSTKMIGQPATRGRPPPR
jgi:2-isopropylmalate synthase